MTLEGSGGLTVECGVLAPKDARRHTAVILLGGRAAGKRSIENARNLPPVVVVSPGYRLDAPEPGSLLEALRLVPAARARLFEVPLEALLAADYARSREDVDPARVVLLGVSFGALFVPCIAAGDPHFAAVVMVDGGGGLPSLIRHNLRPYADGVTSAAGGWLGGLLLRPMEPLRFASRIAPAPLLLLNGREDERIPRENVDAFFLRAREPKKLIWIDAPHVDPGRPELMGEIVGVLDRELRALRVL